MKSLLICLALISMVMTSQEVTAEKKYLKFLDCHHPNPPPHCSIGNRGYVPVPANPYRRGCSAISRCRGGG